MKKPKRFRKLTQNDVGRWATVRWDDMGRCDGVIVAVSDGNVEFFHLADSSLSTLDDPATQVVEVRDYLQAWQETGKRI